MNAEKRFLYLVKKLNNNTHLKADYKAFIDEYKNLNHMHLIDQSIVDNQNTFYLPHHCIIKPSSTTTKLRVVFNASGKSTSGVSLNVSLMIGPVVQEDLMSIVMRFRKHVIAYTTDIKKMYRQIRVNDRDTPYQRILWRNDESKPIDTYELSTVTYGTAAAPYLATKTLNTLAQLESNEYPMATKVIIKDFYVDDLLSGADNIHDAISIQKDIVSILKKEGFELYKWSSNSNELLNLIPLENR